MCWTSLIVLVLASLAIAHVSAAQAGPAATLVLRLESQVSCDTRTVTHTVVGTLSIAEEGATAEITQSQYEVNGASTPIEVSPTMLSTDVPEARSGPATIPLGVEVAFSFEYVVTVDGTSTSFGAAARAHPADPDLACPPAPTSAPASGPSPTAVPRVASVPPAAEPAVAVVDVVLFTG